MISRRNKTDKREKYLILIDKGILWTKKLTKKLLRKLLKKIEQIHEDIEDRIAIATADYSKAEDFEKFAKRLKI